MSQLPVVSGRQAVKAFGKIGYQLDRQTGSHMILRHHEPPHRRLTVPQDVANAIALLSRPEAAWITGNVIHVDGGESIAG